MPGLVWARSHHQSGHSQARASGAPTGSSSLRLARWNDEAAVPGSTQLSMTGPGSTEGGRGGLGEGGRAHFSNEAPACPRCAPGLGSRKARGDFGQSPAPGCQRPGWAESPKERGPAGSGTPPADPAPSQPHPPRLGCAGPGTPVPSGWRAAAQGAAAEQRSLRPAPSRRAPAPSPPRGAQNRRPARGAECAVAGTRRRRRGQVSAAAPARAWAGGPPPGAPFSLPDPPPRRPPRKGDESVGRPASGPHRVPLSPPPLPLPFPPSPRPLPSRAVARAGTFCRPLFTTPLPFFVLPVPPGCAKAFPACGACVREGEAGAHGIWVSGLERFPQSPKIGPHACGEGQAPWGSSAGGGMTSQLLVWLNLGLEVRTPWDPLRICAEERAERGGSCTGVRCRMF